MMTGVGDSEIGGAHPVHYSLQSCSRALIQELLQSSHSTWMSRVVPELSFKVENLRSSATIGNKRLAGFLDNLKLGNESRVEFIKLLSEASPNMLP